MKAISGRSGSGSPRRSSFPLRRDLCRPIRKCLWWRHEARHAYRNRRHMFVIDLRLEQELKHCLSLFAYAHTQTLNCIYNIYSQVFYKYTMPSRNTHKSLHIQSYMYVCLNQCTKYSAFIEPHYWSATMHHRVNTIMRDFTAKPLCMVFILLFYSAIFWLFLFWVVSQFCLSLYLLRSFPLFLRTFFLLHSFNLPGNNQIRWSLSLWGTPPFPSRLLTFHPL